MPVEPRFLSVRVGGMLPVLPQQVFPVVVAVGSARWLCLTFYQGHKYRATPKTSRTARFRCALEVMGVSARGNLAWTAAIRR